MRLYTVALLNAVMRTTSAILKKAGVGRRGGCERLARFEGHMRHHESSWHVHAVRMVHVVLWKNWTQRMPASSSVEPNDFFDVMPNWFNRPWTWRP